MKKNLSLLICALIPVTAFAGGTHGDGDGHDHGHDRSGFSVGEPADGKPDRVFEVSMRDTMRFVFEPGFEELRRGEVVRFDVRNGGR